MKHIQCLIKSFALLAILFAASPPGLAAYPVTGMGKSPDAGAPIVTIADGAVTLHAEETPLWTLLEVFARHGVRVKADPSLNPPVSLRLEAVPIERALRRILGDVNHVMIWERSGASEEVQLAELRIFNPGQQGRMRDIPLDRDFDLAWDPEDGSFHVRGEVLLRKPPAMSETEFLARIRKAGGEVVDRNGALAVYRVRFPRDTDIPALVTQLREDGNLGTAEPNYAYPILLPYRGTADGSGALADLRLADGAARVAVLDSGLLPGAGMDETVIAAYDAVNPGNPMTDALGHGTQMAMIASGRVSPFGVTGGPKSPRSNDTAHPVVAIRAFDDNGFTSNFSLMRSIDFAAENGARVLSLSWGSDTHSQFMEDILNHAAGKGMILLAAAGNEPTGQNVYPAAYDAVIGVGALSPDGKRWEQSNYGDFVRISAPGFAELPVGYQGQPGIYAGTSIATAYAANAVAKYLTENPAASKAEVLRMLDEKF